MAAEGLTAKRSAACRIELPFDTARAIRSRKSRDKGAVMGSSCAVTSGTRNQITRFRATPNRSSIRLDPKPALERAEVVERFVDHREADDGVDEVGRDVHAVEHPEDHRRGVPDGEERDVERDVLRAVEEEDHAGEEQEVVVAGHHVLGAEIDEGDQVDARDLLDVALVALCDPVGEGRPCREQDDGEDG